MHTCPRSTCSSASGSKPGRSWAGWARLVARPDHNCITKHERKAKPWTRTNSCVPKRTLRASFEASDNASVTQVAEGNVLLDVLYLDRFLAESLLSQGRFHELIEISIEHAAGVRGRDSGAQILDHLVGLQNV